MWKRTAFFRDGTQRHVRSGAINPRHCRAIGHCRRFHFPESPNACRRFGVWHPPNDNSIGPFCPIRQVHSHRHSAHRAGLAICLGLAHGRASRCGAWQLTIGRMPLRSDRFLAAGICVRGYVRLLARLVHKPNGGFISQLGYSRRVAHIAHHFLFALAGIRPPVPSKSPPPAAPGDLCPVAACGRAPGNFRSFCGLCSRGPSATGWREWTSGANKTCSHCCKHGSSQRTSPEFKVGLGTCFLDWRRSRGLLSPSTPAFNR